MFSIPFLLLVLIPTEDKPAPPKLPIGKETTYVDGPVDKNGFIDYEAALNDRLGKGVTPEKNANVLLWRAFGPRPEGSRMPAEFYKRLGTDEPPAAGDYLIGITTYVKDHLKLERGEWDAIFNQQGWATQRPWVATDYPHIAAWLKANEKPLAVVVEASKRPDYYNPLVSHRNDKDPGSLISVLLSGVQKTRELASALTARAMLRLGEGKVDEAWQDLLACHRLARLMIRGATLIEALVAIAIENIVSNADLAFLEHGKLTSKQIQDRLKDLQGLPPIPAMAGKIDLAERFMFLDCAQLIRRGGVGMLEGFVGGGPAPKELTAEQKKALAAIDWEPALRNGNKWYDRLASAMLLKDRAAREAEFDKIDVELKALKADALKEQPDLIKGLLEGKDPGKRAGKALGDVLISLLVPAVRKVQSAHDRTEQIQRNLHLAFHLAAYRRDHGRYPEKLEHLVPKYVPAIPGDLFSGKPIIYRPSEKGYLLYSVGANGKDENGHWHDDDPPGDDPRVRMPLPELKKK